ncbi:MmcB family DNA repair protein [Parapedomonas caeni]
MTSRLPLPDPLPDPVACRVATPPADAPAGPLTADDVARGVCRLLAAQGRAALLEFPLGNGRRPDVAALDRDGRITLIEIKVSRADLRGDRKWPDYLDYCDEFYFAVPAGFPLDDFDTPAFAPATAGLIVADRFEAAVLRPAAVRPLNGNRRRVVTLRFARRAADRLSRHLDPGLG